MVTFNISIKILRCFVSRKGKNKYIKYSIDQNHLCAKKQSLFYRLAYTVRPVACLLFGSAAWKIASRDQFVGWDRTTRRRNLRLMTNNTRFLILPWVRIPHLASHILGASLRRLRQDWVTKYGHGLCLVETFVDRSRFAGTCYRAANWRKIGQSKGRSRQDRNHKLQVSIKDIYVYPLTADYRQQIKIKRATKTAELWLWPEVEAAVELFPHLTKGKGKPWYL